MRKLILVILPLCFLLTGCPQQETTKKKIADLSGCEIIKAYVKGESYPIYLADCKNKDSVTTTYNTGGKSNFQGVTVTVVEKESADLEQKKAELDKKKNALSKLTDEEKKLLGLQ